MSVRLLDVNVLVSLLDSAHEHHAASLQWFRKVAAVEGWASCPITENGLIRIVSGVGYPNLRLSPMQVGKALAQFRAAFPGIYQFWPDEVSLTDPELFDLGLLTGSRQTTDVYLAGLALRRGGKLATIDGSIAWRAVKGADAGLIERIAPDGLRD